MKLNHAALQAALAPCLVASSLLTSVAVQAAPATTVHRVFDIVREGTKIGTNTFDITRHGDTAEVKIETHVLVKVMYVNVYRQDHTETATWKGAQLVSFTSKTDDNGTPHEVDAAQSGAKMSLTVDGARSDGPKGLAPASLWSIEAANRSQLFDPGTGKKLSTKAQDLGDETVSVHGIPLQLRHVKLAGQFDRDLWFDKDGLVKLTMLGSDRSLVTAEMRAATASR